MHGRAPQMSAAVRRRLRLAEGRVVNYDPTDPSLFTPAHGWEIDDCRKELPPEPAGQPTEGGSWEIARRLMAGYEFADPSIVRAFYDPATPLDGRTMLLRLTALGLFHVNVGVRIVRLTSEQRSIDGRRAHVWGWAYRTLEGHVEMGEMRWEVWKWHDTGTVEFRVHAYSRRAPISNPIVNIGFRLVGAHHRRAFLDSTQRRMVELTAAALRGDDSVAEASRRSVAHPHAGDSDVHAEVSGRARGT